MKQNFFPVLATCFIATALAAEPPVKVKIDKSGEFRSGGAVTNATKPTAGSADVQLIRFHRHGQFERLVLDFHAWEGYEKIGEKTATIARPSGYFARFEEAPFRLYFEVASRYSHGIENHLPDLTKSELVRRIYPVPLFDDASIAFAIELEGPVEFEIFELHEPARIVIDLRPPNSQADPGGIEFVYSVRSESLRSVAEINEISEAVAAVLPDSLPRVLLTSDNQGYCVEATSSFREWKANMLREGLPESVRDHFIVEKRMAAATPASSP